MGFRSALPVLGLSKPQNPGFRGLLAFWMGGVSPGAVQPEVVEQPGRVKHKQGVRFATKYKGEYYSFDSLEALEQFVRAQQPKKKAKKKRPVVTVVPEFQAELYEYDLPALQPFIDRGDYSRLRAILAQFERLQQAALEARLNQDEEEAILLLLA